MNRGMLGKVAKHVARNAMTIQALETACFLIKDVNGIISNNLNSNLENSFTDIIKVINSDAFVINKFVLQRAINMSDYFMKSKLIMSRYHVNPVASIESILNDLFQENDTVLEVTGRFIRETSRNITIIKRILFYEVFEASITDIANGNYKKQEMEYCLTIIQNAGLGETFPIKSGNSRWVEHFRIIDIDQFRSSAEYGSFIQDLGINIKKFEKHLIELNRSVGKPVKRKRVPSKNSEPANAKKARIEILPTTTLSNKKNGLPYLISFSPTSKNVYKPHSVIHQLNGQVDVESSDSENENMASQASDDIDEDEEDEQEVEFDSEQNVDENTQYPPTKQPTQKQLNHDSNANNYAKMMKQKKQMVVVDEKNDSQVNKNDKISKLAKSKPYTAIKNSNEDTSDECDDEDGQKSDFDFENIVDESTQYPSQKRQKNVLANNNAECNINNIKSNVAYISQKHHSKNKTKPFENESDVENQVNTSSVTSKGPKKKLSSKMSSKIHLIPNTQENSEQDDPYDFDNLQNDTQSNENNPRTSNFNNNKQSNNLKKSNIPIDNANKARSKLDKPNAKSKLKRNETLPSQDTNLTPEYSNSRKITNLSCTSGLVKKTTPNRSAKDAATASIQQQAKLYQYNSKPHL
jgi:hypothetical protein